MNRQQFIDDYWSYYKILENKFLETSQYVELDDSNKNTFSKEYIFLLEAIGAELDVVFKLFCGFDLGATKCIADYATTLIDSGSGGGSYPTIVDEEVRVLNTDIVLNPFKDWDSQRARQSLTWWDAFDNIKHNRVLNKTVANFENVINALSGLYLLEMKYLQSILEEGESGFPDKNSELFLVKGWNIYDNGPIALGSFVQTD